MASNEALAALIWCPFPDSNDARHLARSLLDEDLIACANIVAGMESLFKWDGRLDEAHEAVALFKTNSALLDRAIARIVELHPYDEPAVVGWRCDAAAAGTIAWLGAIGQ